MVAGVNGDSVEGGGIGNLWKGWGIDNVSIRANNTVEREVVYGCVGRIRIPFFVAGTFSCFSGGSFLIPLIGLDFLCSVDV